MRFFYIVIICFYSLVGKSQCGLSDSHLIQDLDNEMPDTTNVSILVSGAVQNNLNTAAQGLCGVLLKFKHPFEKELFIELISPAGEKITLVGGDIVATNTPLITWDVTFVPCASTASPDPGFMDVWENDQLWQSLNTYTGQYYPHIGCLEDFDMGTVNGTWTLRCIDFEDSGKGTLLDASLIFCEPEGTQCGECTLNPGRIANADLMTCQGDSTLEITINKVFYGNSYNDQIYDYSNVIFRDTVIYAHQSAVDLRSALPGIYTICGIQTARLQSNLIPPPGTNYNQTSLNQYFFLLGACAEVSDSCMSVLIAETIPAAIDTQFICYGDTLILNGMKFSQEGDYTIVYEKGACDSIVILQLMVVKPEALITAITDSITCSDSFISLEGFNTGTTSPAVQYNWFTTNGNIISDPAVQNAEISKNGLYYLEVTVTGQHYSCKDTTVKEIFNDNSFPSIVLSGDTLTCILDTVEIKAQFSDVIISEDWYSPSGAFIRPTPSGAKVTKPGWYYLTVTGANGCNTTDSVFISQDTLFMDPLFTSDTITCNKDSVLIEVAVSPERSYTYHWNGVKSYYENSRQPWVDTPGVYGLTMTDPQNGCTGEYAILVAENITPPAVLSLEIDTITCTRHGVIPVMVIDQPVSQYLWNGPGLFSTLPSPEISQSGNFSVQITSAVNGCNSTFSFTVYADTLIPTVTLNAALLSCDKDPLPINLESNIPLILTTWNGPNGFFSTNRIPFVTEPGNYTVNFVGANGCEGQQSIIIANSTDIPETSFKIDSIKCNQDTLKFVVISTNGSYNYQWTGPGLISDNVAEPLVTKPGWYSVTITDENTGCFNEKTFEVIDDRIFPIADFKIDTLNCKKDSVQILVQNEDIIAFTLTGPAYMSDVISPFVKWEGTYWYTMTNNKGCTTTGSIEVLRNDTLPAIEALFDLIRCGQDSLNVLATSSIEGTSFFWDGPDGFQKQGKEIVAYTGGTYRLQGIAPNGCTANTVFNIGYDTLAPVFEINQPEVLTCNTPTTTLSTTYTNATGTVRWFPGGQVGNSLNVNQSGWYIAEVTAQNNCISKDSVFVQELKNYPEFEVAATVINCKDMLSSISVTPTTPFSNIIWENTVNPDFIQNGLLNHNTSFDGTYLFSVINEENCVTKGQIQVIADNRPPQIVSAFSDTISCIRPEVILGVILKEPAIEYLWNGPGVNDVKTDSLLTVTEEGIYYLQITGKNFCVTNHIFTVFKGIQMPQYELFSDTLTCDQGKINIGVNPTSPVSAYEWDGPDNFTSNARNPKVFLPGTYTVTITGENGCSSVATIDVFQDISKPQISMSDTLFLPCNGSAIQLKINSDSEIDKYFWRFPSGEIVNDSMPSAQTEGEYSVQVSGLNGCASNEFKFYVTSDRSLPAFNVLTDTITCRDSLVILKVISQDENLFFEWTNPAGSHFIGKELETGLGGNYWLKVADNNGCSDSVQVFVAADTSRAQIQLERKGSIQCENKLVMLKALVTGGNQNYQTQWSTSNGNISKKLSDFNIEIDQPGKYLFKFTNSDNGCETETEVVIDTVPALFTSVLTEVNAPLCDEINNGSIRLFGLNGTPPYQIRINGINRFQQLVFNDLSAGSYNLLISDSLGCKVEKTIEISSGPSLLFNIEKEVLVLFGDSVLLQPDFILDTTGVARFSWFKADSVLCVGCSSLWVRPFVNTVYHIEYDVNGLCKSTADVLVKVKNDIEKAIPNIITPASPQGNNRFFIPQTRGIEKVNQILIFNRWAENVFNGKNMLPGDAEAGWDGTFNGKEVQPGVFVVFVELLLSNGTIWKYQGDVTVLR